MKRSICILIVAALLAPAADLCLGSRASADVLVSWTEIKQMFQDGPEPGGCGGGSSPPPNPPDPPSSWTVVWEIARFVGTV